MKAAESTSLSLTARTILQNGFCGGADGVFAIDSVYTASVPRGYRWKALVLDQLGVSESEGVLRDYLACGDNVPLANLIHITRQFFFGGVRFILYALPNLLLRIFGFDIQNTLPGLWNDCCASFRPLPTFCPLLPAFPSPVVLVGLVCLGTAVVFVNVSFMGLGSLVYTVSYRSRHHPTPVIPSRSNQYKNL